MKTIHSFLKLKSSLKILFIKTLAIHWIVRIMLWIVPFSIIQNKIKKITPTHGSEKSPPFPLERLIWAVNVTSRYTLRSNCLSKALTGQILLARSHYPSTIRIGVARDKGEFEAHAWLVHEDKIVLGESPKDYVPLMDIEQNAL